MLPDCSSSAVSWAVGKVDCSITGAGDVLGCWIDMGVRKGRTWLYGFYGMTLSNTRLLSDFYLKFARRLVVPVVNTLPSRKMFFYCKDYGLKVRI